MDGTSFYKEVRESLERDQEEKLPVGNLIMEINASRHAYNIKPYDVARFIMKAVLTIGAGDATEPTQLLINLTKAFDRWKELLAK